MTPFGGTRHLADEDQAGDGDAPAIGRITKTGERRKAALSQALAQKGNRVRAQAQALAAVVFDDLAAHSHDRERHRGFGNFGPELRGSIIGGGK